MPLVVGGKRQWQHEAETRVACLLAQRVVQWQGVQAVMQAMETHTDQIRVQVPPPLPPPTHACTL